MSVNSLCLTSQELDELHYSPYPEELQKHLNCVDWNFPVSGKAKDIHSIHPYPAKFIPEIPHHLIKKLGIQNNTAVLDPFCGSGVTLCEAQKFGLESIGIDLNPIACMISRVKTSPLNSDLVSIAKEVMDYAESNSSNFERPDIPNLDHWFKPHVQLIVAGLLEGINSIQVDTYTTNALLLGLSSILVRISNQDSDTRYAAVEKDMPADKILQIYLGSVSNIEKLVTNLPDSRKEAKIINKNILEITPDDIGKKIGLVITSPPYPNAYEYWLYHKYRMFWLGYNANEVKKNEIGARAHYFKKNHATAEDFKTQMRQIMKTIKTVLIDDGYCCIVIGRSIIHGVFIDNATMICNLAKELDLKEIANIERTLASSRKSFNLSHAKIATENILIFQK